MVTQGLIKEMIRIAGRGNVLFSPRDLLAYSYDATQRQEMPEVIVFAHSTSEISSVMKLAYRESIPVVPRGAGTGISGGAIPIKGGIVLELSRMNQIIALDTANRRAIVEPGVINLDLQDALAPLGFMYPPDPASQKSCTLGGNIGENAGGPLCFRYGVTSKYVCGMEVVLPDGEVIELGGGVEDISGYDLRGLLIGSEGTLGIATRLTLHIVPLPESSRTMLAIFDALEGAGQAVSDIVSAGIVPAALELMDKKMCWAIEESLHAGYPVNAEGVLLIEVSGLADGLDRQTKAISDICHHNKVRELRLAQDSAEKELLWKGRKGAFGSVARICPPYKVNDGTVPRNQLVPALRKIQEISEKYRIQIANVAHAGDGNLHPLILFDRDNQEENLAAKKTGEEILDVCLALGGTISGEHGIGLEKLAAMTRMFTQADLAIMRKVKEVFDPDNIINPGKLLPPEGNKTQPAQEKDSSITVNDTSNTFAQTLAGIVGMNNLLTGEKATRTYQIDGMVPDIVVFPSTTEQVAQIIKASNRYQKSIIPWGSGSKQEYGTCVSAFDVILDLKNMRQILDFDKGNSTVRVGAGKANGELQREMAQHRLFFPLDPPFMESSTIGGELAASDSGPARFMYGNARDLILGMTVVTPEGDIIHPGGKTMKNVAGLDLGKLYVGSWGTLGIITEAVLRLFPVPEVNRSMGLTFPSAENAFRMVNELLNSKLTPGAIELVDWVAGRHLEPSCISPLEKDETWLLIRVEGDIEITERHVKEISAMALSAGASIQTPFENEQSTETWNAYRHLHQSFMKKYPSILKGKTSVPISKSAEMFKAARRTGDKYSSEIGIQASCGNGVLNFYFPAGKETAFDILDDLRRDAARLEGIFTLETAPYWLRKDMKVRFQSGAHALMERLKKALDPNNILNPGKGIGGQYSPCRS